MRNRKKNSTRRIPIPHTSYKNLQSIKPPRCGGFCFYLTRKCPRATGGRLCLPKNPSSFCGEIYVTDLFVLFLFNAEMPPHYGGDFACRKIHPLFCGEIYVIDLFVPQNKKTPADRGGMFYLFKMSLVSSTGSTIFPSL